MSITKSYWFVIALFLLAAVTCAEAEAPNENDNKPQIQELGDQRYQIGSIIIDKKRKEFSVSGVVLRKEPPLEFVAVTKGGNKAYESLLELNANAFEFNLACILIGLDSKKSQPSKFHFDPSPVQGDAVNVLVSWQSKDKNTTIAVADIFKNEKMPAISDKWIYTGSSFTENNIYLAEMDGTLIGFSHDPASIIEHKEGIGLGDYGSVTINSSTVPAVGEMVKIIVKMGK
jgi:hypothetical protein